MSFLSLPFFFLFAVVLLLNHIFSSNLKIRKIILLVSSILFYAMCNIWLAPILLLIILITYFCGKWCERRGNLVVFILFDIILLAFFKWFNLISYSISSYMGNGTYISIIVPLGLSFYIFRSISYIVDLKRNDIVSWGILDVALYISYFPQIISGPIVKAKNFGNFNGTFHNVTQEDLQSGLWLFVIGMVKKIVIADRLAVAVDAVFNAPLAYSSLSVIMAVITYSFQLYFDFAGYSDMSNGLSKMLGINECKNFNMPYLSKNPTEFWKRWHISLSSWLQDYVYIPLGGNRKGTFRTYVNLLITMSVGGIWHGVTFNYLLWGVYHGIGLICHKVYSKYMKKFKQIKSDNVFKVCISILFNYLFVSIGWIFFRADSIDKAFKIIKKCFDFSYGINYYFTYSLVYIGVYLFFAIYMLVKNERNGLSVNLSLNKFWNMFLFSFIIFMIIMLYYSGDRAFIYAAY